MILLPGLLPASIPMFAVFSNEDGQPRVEPVVFYGVFEKYPNSPTSREVVAFSQGDRVKPADHRPDFIALTTDRDAAKSPEFKRRCKKLHTDLAKAARDIKVSKVMKALED